MILSLADIFFRGRRPSHVFVFWDGHRKREADPIAAWKVLREHVSCKLDADLAATEAGDLEALERLVGMTREMFGLPAWSEETGGLTISETYLVLLSFLDFMDRRATDASRRSTKRRIAAPAAGA